MITATTAETWIIVIVMISVENIVIVNISVACRQVLLRQHAAALRRRSKQIQDELVSVHFSYHLASHTVTQLYFAVKNIHV